jgi:hypothetical protein
MFQASSVPIIRSYLLYTRQLVRFMQVMWPLPSTPDSARKRSHNLLETYQMPCVQQVTPDDGHRRCLKHVVLGQNKFWIFDASSWLFCTKKMSELLIHYDKAGRHTSVCAAEAIRNFGWTILPHPPYSYHLAPPHYPVFRPLIKGLREHQYGLTWTLQNTVHQWPHRKDSNFY